VAAACELTCGVCSLPPLAPSPSAPSQYVSLLSPVSVPAAPSKCCGHGGSHWCADFRKVDGSADALGRHGHHDNELFEVMHWLSQDEGDKYGTRWLMHTPGSGLWYDPGRTLVVQTHADVNHHFDVPCPCFDDREPYHTETYCENKWSTPACRRLGGDQIGGHQCPTVSWVAIEAARNSGLYDSIQILRHWMNGDCDYQNYEIIDLRGPYVPWPPAGTLMVGYYNAAGEPCRFRELAHAACPLAWGADRPWLGCEV